MAAKLAGALLRLEPRNAVRRGANLETSPARPDYGYCADELNLLEEPGEATDQRSGGNSHRPGLENLALAGVLRLAADAVPGNAHQVVLPGVEQERATTRIGLRRLRESGEPQTWQRRGDCRRCSGSASQDLDHLELGVAAAADGADSRCADPWRSDCESFCGQAIDGTSPLPRFCGMLSNSLRHGDASRGSR
jgi:hypothetical protein